MVNAKKASILKIAIIMLQGAQGLVQRALGDTDAGESTCKDIQDLVDDLQADVVELIN